MVNTNKLSLILREFIKKTREELRRAKKIGHTMVTASKTTTDLHQLEGQLGRMIVKRMKDGLAFNQDDTEIKKFVEQIGLCEEEINLLEGQIKKIKYSSPSF